MNTRVHSCIANESAGPEVVSVRTRVQSSKRPNTGARRGSGRVRESEWRRAAVYVHAICTTRVRESEREKQIRSNIVSAAGRPKDAWTCPRTLFGQRPRGSFVSVIIFVTTVFHMQSQRYGGAWGGGGG